jgi:hypothetical protein
MSVARRELKTVDELQGWIESHVESSGVLHESGNPPYRIVRRPPTAGAADWRVVVDVPAPAPTAARSPRPRWNSALRHAIGTAQLLFDIR